MSTVVKYGPVTMRGCETIRFDQSVQYDESNTDMLYHRFDIEVACHVHIQGDHFLQIDISGQGTSTDPQAKLRQLHDALMQPRQEFEYSIGGNQILRATPNAANRDTDLDLNNGPKPVALNVQNVFGQHSFRITFRIEVCIVRCGFQPAVLNYDGSGNPNVFGGQRAVVRKAVLNNRWSLTEWKDAHHYTVRVFEGTLRVAHSSVWPHLQRYLVVPPLQQTYQRVSQRFVQSADGLTLKYQIQDRQRQAAPPAPALDWRVTHTESTGEHGIIGYSEISIWLKGPRGVNKGDLLVVAGKIVTEKIGWLARAFQKGPRDGIANVLNPGDGLRLRNASIVDQLDDSTLQFRVAVQRTAQKKKKYKNVRMEEILGRPLSIDGYNPDRWPVPSLFDGRSPAGVFATYLQHPCDDRHGVTQAQTVPGQFSQKVEEDEPPTTEVYQSPGQLDQDVDGYTEDQEKGLTPYTVVEINSDYYTDRGGYIHLPVANTNVPQNNITSQIFQAHAGMAKRRFVMRAERLNDWPQVPRPSARFSDPNQIVHTLLTHSIHPDEPILQPDGSTLLYVATVTYEYALSRMPTEPEKLITGSSPVDETDPNDTLIVGANFYTDGIQEPGRGSTNPLIA